jgi:hypothetical protein
MITSGIECPFFSNDKGVMKFGTSDILENNYNEQFNVAFLRNFKE